MMRTMLLAATAVGIGGLAGTAHAAAPQMKEGLWEITATMDLPGMPKNVPPQKVQQCITRKDLENPQNMARGPETPGSRCETTDYRLQGNTATWKVSCKGENAMTGTGSMTFTETSYNGTSRMTVTRGGETMNLTMSYTGRYIGPCPK